MTRAWFPMSSVHVVRDGRHVELRPVRPEHWETDKARKDYDGRLRTFVCVDDDGTKFLIANWSDRQWVLNAVGDMEGGSCWDLIDDHFTGWRNLKPEYPDEADQYALCFADQVARLEGRVAALEVLAMDRAASPPDKGQTE